MRLRSFGWTQSQRDAVHLVFDVANESSKALYGYSNIISACDEMIVRLSLLLRPWNGAK